MNKKLGIALFIFFILNIIQIVGLDLSHDEAYYWIYSNTLSWGYYDHPPMVALFIKLGTLLFGNNEFGVRIFFNLMSLFSFYLAYKITNPKNIFLFILLFFSFPLIQASGFFALPDTCLLFFSTLYFYFLKKYLEEEKLKWSALLSLSITCMLYSKYHAGLIILLTLISLPKLFKKKSFYLITFFSLLLFMPHLMWQYEHDWLTFKFHLFKRTEKHFDIKNILDFSLGQIALSGLFSGLILYYGLFKYKTKNDFERVLKTQILGFIIFLFFLSFRNKIEANWTITIFIPLLILSEKVIKNKRLLLFSSLPIIVIILSLRVILLFPASKIPIARLDEFHGFKEISQKVSNLCQNEIVAANEYQLASKLSFYLEKDIRALHLFGRKSEFSLLSKVDYTHKKVCLLSFKKLKGSDFLAHSYPDDIYLLKDSYEEILKFEK